MVRPIPGGSAIYIYKWVPFSVFRYMKGYGFRLVEACEGVGENLSFRSLINLKGGYRRIL